jgi:hypothetical protein
MIRYQSPKMPTVERLRASAIKHRQLSTMLCLTADGRLIAAVSPALSGWGPKGDVACYFAITIISNISSSVPHQGFHRYRALERISICRTSALGGHIQACPDGHMEKAWYNSCRERSCPECNFTSVERWLDKQKARLINCDYYHIIFTIPHELIPLWLVNAAKRKVLGKALGTFYSQPVNQKHCSFKII